MTRTNLLSAAEIPFYISTETGVHEDTLLTVLSRLGCRFERMEQLPSLRSHGVFIFHIASALKHPDTLLMIRNLKAGPIFIAGPVTQIRIGLSLFCDDYIPLPLCREVAHARIFRKIPVPFRTSEEHSFTCYQSSLRGDLGSAVLDDREQAMLQLLAAYKPDPLPRSVIHDYLFANCPESSRFPDMVISSLRGKICTVASGHCSPISSVRGIGYRL